MLIALLVLIGFATQTGVETADAPFTILATKVTRAGTEVFVSVGTDPARARLVKQAIIITDSAAVPAALARTKRVCIDVCPGEKGNGRVCHFEAVLRTAQTIGNAIAVLPGRPAVGRVTALRAGPDEKIARPEEWVTASPAPNFESGFESGLRWVHFPDGIYLTSADNNRDVYSPPIALSACTSRALPPFTVLACGGAQALYEGKRGIIVSFADYGDDSAMPIARFQLDSRDAVLIRLGLKGEMVIALLVKEDGEWRLMYRSADYGLIC